MSITQTSEYRVRYDDLSRGTEPDRIDVVSRFVDVGATLSQLHALGGNQVEDECNRKYKRSIKQTDDEVIVATLERV